MTHTFRSLVVLTLLQLYRAQDAEDQTGNWYQAKVVTDDYSPQPIQEIFSTAKSIPSQPIVVLPTGSTAVDDDEAYQVQGLPSSTQQQQSTPSSSPVVPSEPTFITTFSKVSPPTSQFVNTKSTFITSSPPPSITSLSTQPPFFGAQPQFPQPAILQLQNQTLQGIIFPINQPQVTINNQATTPSTVNTQPAQQTTPLRTTVMRTRTALPQTTSNIPPRPTSVSTLSTLSVTPRLQPTVSTRLTSNSSLPFPLIKIRVVAPSGSVTNIRFMSTTTKRPTSRTTRTPRTRNTYNGCLDTCGKKTPICAAPLSSQMRADNLKGFPSICHMACHNSFKNNRYEKVIDGRCGKLRTHIRTLGSNKKLKKEELQKNQYTVVKDSNAIVEFESLV